jgi:hypothetical protein
MKTHDAGVPLVGIGLVLSAMYEKGVLSMIGWLMLIAGVLILSLVDD